MNINFGIQKENTKGFGSSDTSYVSGDYFFNNHYINDLLQSKLHVHTVYCIFWIIQYLVIYICTSLKKGEKDWI